MANKAQSNIDLNNKQLLNAVFENLSIQPSNPKEGSFYYDKTKKALLFYNGSKWVNNSEISIEDLPDLSSLYIAVSRIGVASGVVPLDSNTKIDNSYINIDTELNDESSNTVSNSAITTRINTIENTYANNSLTNLNSTGNNYINTVLDVNSNNRLSFWAGLEQDYETATIDNNTLYFITDEGKIYLGSTLLTAGVPVATTSVAGKVKPDGTTIDVQNDGTISVIGSFANKDLNNLTSFGNARLQYQPFAINSGTVDANGENATLSTGVSYKKYNFVEQGTLTKNDGVISGFSSSNYGKLSSNFEQVAPTADSWDYQLVFTTGNNISTEQYVFGNYEHITNPTAWWGQGITVYNGKIGFRVAYPDVYLYTTATANTTYLVQCGYDSATGYYFKCSNDNGLTWLTEQTSANTTKMRWESNSYITALGVNGNLRVGGQPFNGSIDLNSCYININGNLFWQGVSDGTSSDYDFTVGGSSEISCDPCIITTADGRTKEFFTTASLSVAGEQGTMYVETPFVQPVLSANGTLGGDSFAVSASRNNTNQEAWQGLSANGENNGGWSGSPSDAENYYIFYNPLPLNVKSIFISQVGAWWVSRYTLLGSNDGTTWSEIGIGQGGQDNGYGTVSNFNSTEFYKYHKMQITNWGNGPAFNRLKITGTCLQEISGGNYAIFRDYSTGNLSITSSLTISPATPTNPSSGDYWLDNSQIPLVLKTYDTSVWVTDNDKVYLGDCTIASGVVSALTNRRFNHGWNIDTPHIVETYKNGSSYYRVYSDGWCEQSGYATGSANKTVTLLKTYKDTNYTIFTQGRSSTATYWSGCPTVSNITTSSFIIGTQDSDRNCYWHTCGYIS